MQNSPYTLAHIVWLEGIGTTSLDQIGGYTANLVGAPAWSTNGPFTDAHSVVLNGTSQFITVPGLLANGQREFTVAVRYKPGVLLPDGSDRRLWSITTHNAPDEETLDVLWRRNTDNGGYLWVRGIQGGVLSGNVSLAGLKAPPGLWASVVITAGLAGLYVHHNGVKVGGRNDFPWPAIKSGTDHDFTIGGLSSIATGFLSAAVGEVLVEGRMWTDKEAVLWHAENIRYSVEQGKWLKNPWNPVLTPTQPLDQGSLQEPNLLYENGIYKLWYTGGFSKEQINYATSPNGLTWAKCPINPVLGGGNGGESGDAARGFVVKVADIYYLYYNSNPWGDERLATSSDGIRWRSQGVIIPTSALTWNGGFGNSCVWVEGKTWYMIFECYHKVSNLWEMGLATSTDGRAWSLYPNPLRSMQIGDGTYGGPMVIKHNGLYHCWYHAAAKYRLGDNGFLPTAVYRATSSDRVNWQVYSTIPVLSLTQQYEVDQVADPTIAEINGRCIMLVDQMNNSSPGVGRLGLAAFEGALDLLLTDNAVPGRGLPPIAALDLLLLR
jgi:hypothetical protein